MSTFLINIDTESRDPEWEREVSVLTDALGEQSLPPALAYDPVSCAGGRHHHNHSYEAAGEGNYLEWPCHRDGLYRDLWGSHPGRIHLLGRYPEIIKHRLM